MDNDRSRMSRTEEAVSIAIRALLEARADIGVPVTRNTVSDEEIVAMMVNFVAGPVGWAHLVIDHAHLANPRRFRPERELHEPLE